MSKMYLGSLNLNKIDKSKIVTTDKNGVPFKNGAKYLNIVVFINDNPDEYGNNASIQLSKNEGENSIYIGNLKEYRREKEKSVGNSNKGVADNSNEDDLPFQIMDNGWIKIHRKLLDWEWYDEPNTFRLFIHLILKANHKEKKYRGILIKKGEIMTGQDVLSKELKLTRSKIRTALNNLKMTNDLAIKNSPQGSIIQLVNYEKYQVIANGLAKKSPSNRQAIATNKNIKNDKNIYKPDLKEFMIYAKSKFPTEEKYKSVRQNLIWKYQAWEANGWVDGKDKPIKNWKSKLTHNLQYL